MRTQAVTERVETAFGVRRPVPIIDLDTLRLGHGFWYLATPYSRYPDGIEAAFVHACQLAGQLIAAGVPIYSPIAHTHPIALHARMDPLNHQIWLPADEPFMLAAHGLLIAELPGWAMSTGIKFEVAQFERDHKPILQLPIEWTNESA